MKLLITFWNHKCKMKSYCLKCKKDTENINSILLSKCAKCGSKKSRFIKYQVAKGILSNLGIRALLSKVPLLGDVLF